jgi:peroxiredoxin
MWHGSYFTFVFLLLILAPGQGPEAIAQDAPPDRPYPVIEGTITTSGDGPAVVSIAPNRNAVTKRVETAADGSFSLRTDTTGVVLLTISTPFGYGPARELYLPPTADTIRVSVRTEPFEVSDPSPRVIGDFNASQQNNGVIRMSEQSDGTFQATVPTPGDSLRYGLVGVVPRATVPGTQADRYEYREGIAPFMTATISVIATPDSTTTLTFDPGAVASDTAEPAQLSFAEPESPAARLATFADEASSHLSAYFRKRQRAMLSEDEQDGKAFVESSDFAVEDSLLADVIDADVTADFANAAMMVSSVYRASLDSTFSNRLIRSVPAGDPLWGLHGATSVIRAGSGASSSDPGGSSHAFETHRDLLLDIASSNPDENARAYAIGALTLSAEELGETASESVLRAWLLSAYPNTQIARRLRRQSPKHVVAVGDTLPSFSIASVRNPGTKHSVESMDAKLILVDFFTTWCPGCIEDVAEHKEALRTFEDDGFAILSVSMDRSASDATAFIENYDLSWPVVYLQGGLNHELAKRLNITGFPSPFLVDSTGNVIALGSDARGERLLDLLRERLSGE